MLRRVTLVRTEVSKELSSSIISVKRITELGTMLAVQHIVLQLLGIVNVVLSSLILFTFMMDAISFSETSVLIRITRRHIPEGDLLQEISDVKKLYFNRPPFDNCSR
jgi:hypothetical protein